MKLMSACKFVAQPDKMSENMLHLSCRLRWILYIEGLICHISVCYTRGLTVQFAK